MAQAKDRLEFPGNGPAFCEIRRDGTISIASTGKELKSLGIDYRIVDRNPDRIIDPEHYVLGDAAELEVLQRAGIMDCTSVVITHMMTT